MAEQKRGRVYNRIFNEEEWSEVNNENKNIMEDYLEEYQQRKKKPSTISQYKNDLRIIFIYIKRKLGNKCIFELNKKDFRRMNLWMTEELKQSNARANRLMSAVRSLLTYCEDDDDYDYDNNIAKKVKGLPKEEVREIYFLTNEQVEKLKNELIKREEYAKALLICLAYDSAGRRNELYQVKKHGFLENNATNIVMGKRGKKFPLVYFDWTLECAKLYFEQRGEDEFDSLWVSGKNIKKEVSYSTLYEWFVDIADLLKEIEGVDIPFNPHSIRHSALENLSTGNHYMCEKMGKKDGFTLDELKVYAHHSSSDTTSSYLKNKDTDILSNMFGIQLN